MGVEVRRVARVPRGQVSAATQALGKLIKEERRRLGLSQIGLAAEAGISQAALSYLEAGKFYPKIDTLERIAAVLGWQWEELVIEARRRAAFGVAKI